MSEEQYRRRIQELLEANTELVIKNRELSAEVKNLREAFLIDGELHARAVRDARHEQDARVEAYKTEVDNLRRSLGNLGDEVRSLRGLSPTWRHKKRGSTYRELGRGEIQISNTQGSAVITEGDRLVAYRADTDGRLWFRREPEFDDGRFERID